jgi:hypothetical protein
MLETITPTNYFALIRFLQERIKRVEAIKKDSNSYYEIYCAACQQIELDTRTIARIKRRQAYRDKVWSVKKNRVSKV